MLKSAEEVGFPPIPERGPKKKVCKTAPFAHCLVPFLESAETPLFLQINVFAVWALRLDRKYTIPEKQALLFLKSDLALKDRIFKISKEQRNYALFKALCLQCRLEF